MYLTDKHLAQLWNGECLDELKELHCPENYLEACNEWMLKTLLEDRATIYQLRAQIERLISRSS